jgi:L-seryl-tRNA(Ser) seleniumtransferase
MRPPSVDALARSLRSLEIPHAVAVDLARTAIATGDAGSVEMLARRWRRARLTPVVNGTGVLLHTNLGRAPRPAGASDEPGRSPVPVRYSNLEFDLTSGARGSRQDHAGPLLATLVGAESGLVVNNGAAAVLLVLTALAKDRAVLVSRGELVEIGGGFRLPEIFEACGARMVEVGTTNRTYRSDFAKALSADPAVILRVHRSNFSMTGFTFSPGIDELASLGVPVVADLGSGLLDATTPWLEGRPPTWLSGEPAARQVLESGASLVTFSGDKLLGGPQAGLIAGQSHLVDECGGHPLARALRPGALVLESLEETLLAYLERSAFRIPFWRMAMAPVEGLRVRAETICENAATGLPVDLTAVAGAGSTPGQTIESAGVALDGDHRRLLIDHEPPVLTRRDCARTILDLRTVDPADDDVVAAALRSTRTGTAGRTGTGTGTAGRTGTGTGTAGRTGTGTGTAGGGPPP